MEMRLAVKVSLLGDDIPSKLNLGEEKKLIKGSAGERLHLG